MSKVSLYRSLSIIIAAAIVLSACGATTPAAAPGQPSPIPTRVAASDATAVATTAPTLIPTRVVTRSAGEQPEVSQLAAPSPIGQHPLNGIDLTLSLNPDGTTNLDAPALETGSAARSWRGVWLQETDQGVVVRLNSTAEGVNLLAPVGFQVSPSTDTWQVDGYIVGSASYSAPEVQSTSRSNCKYC
jgi:hypothetical protein